MPNEQESSSRNSNSTSFPNVGEPSVTNTSFLEENTTTGLGSNSDLSSSNRDRLNVQEENGAFEPLEYEADEANEDIQEDDNDFTMDRASIEKEEEEFVAIAEGSPIDELTKKILERLGRPANRGEPPSEYTV
ncbi:hypothetical protein, partial, partial [Parasitella parasitica]